MKYIPITLVVKPSVEVARASEEDLETKDLTKAELDLLFNRVAKEVVDHESDQ